MVAQKGRRGGVEDQYQVTSRRRPSEAVMEREREREMGRKSDHGKDEGIRRKGTKQYSGQEQGSKELIKLKMKNVGGRNNGRERSREAERVTFSDGD